MAISLLWHPLQPSKTLRIRTPATHIVPVLPIGQVTYIHAFRRSDFDGFARRVRSGEAWRNAWRSANDGFEQLLYETKKTVERIDRRYAVSRKLSGVAQSAADRARVLDRDFEITQKWRDFSLDLNTNWPRSADNCARMLGRDFEIAQKWHTFSLDFSTNWPRYRKQLSDFMDTPLGRSATTIFFLWFALSGWLFRILIFSVWVLPFAGPLLIGAVANNLVIKGQCPSCRRQFIGNKNSTVRCANCGNIVWQPKGDFFSRGSRGRGTTPSKSEPDIIDVEFEEK